MEYVEYAILVIGAVGLIVATLALVRLRHREAPPPAAAPPRQRDLPPAAAERVLAEPPAPVKFHALWRSQTRPQEWQPLLVYIFSGSRGLEGARADFRRRISAPFGEYVDSSSTARSRIRHGTQILILPELRGFRFNPPSSRILWLEDYHCVEFRVQALADANSVIEEKIVGRVACYVGPLLIAETPIYVELKGESAGVDAVAPKQPTMVDERILTEEGSSAYRTIFVSYSHKDSCIVEQLERAYRALGDTYLRDVNMLRSGEEWNPALLARIPHADIFQLCWSLAARQSPYVEQEWRHAVKLDRPNFIRPMYWEKPMPDPPPELQHLHFTHVEIDS